MVRAGGAAAGLVVTTTPSPPEALVARARAVAARCGARYVARRHDSATRLGRRAGAALVYVVSREREEVRRVGGGARGALHVHPGLFYLKREAGPGHPLLRALAPAAGRPVERLVDATLGLAGDALFAASALGVEVVGIEASPVLAALLEEGLARLAAEGLGWSAGAARVRLVAGDAAEVLAAMAPGSATAVFLDPMFTTPLGAAPGFDLVRELALDAPLSEALVAAAWRVAARRVVVKVPGASAAPDFSAGPGWNRRVRGGAVDYLVIEGELAEPEYEAPDLGDPERGDWC